MARMGFIMRQLTREAMIGIRVGLLFGLPFTTVGVLGVMKVLPSHDAANRIGIPYVAVFIFLGVVFLGGFVYSVCRRFQVGSHPDLLALERYGQLDELLSEIDTEIANTDDVVSFGTQWQALHLWLRHSGDLRNAQVLLTKSWLLCLINGHLGCRVHAFRLDSVVVAARTRYTLVVGDSHGVFLDITESEDIIGRMRAELMARVPWAINHFDKAVERTWNKNHERIVAQVNQRRKEMQAKKLAQQQS
jgi:hypothetical protein